MISVKIDEILLADFMIKKGNYLFMISTRSDSMVYLYALPDLQYCKSFGIKGKGPGAPRRSRDRIQDTYSISDQGEKRNGKNLRI